MNCDGDGEGNHFDCPGRMIFTQERLVKILRLVMTVMAMTIMILMMMKAPYSICFRRGQSSHHPEYFQCSAKDFGVFRKVTHLAQEGR